jgi:hypothetical protein
LTGLLLLWLLLLLLLLLGATVRLPATATQQFLHGFGRIHSAIPNHDSCM